MKDIKPQRLKRNHIRPTMRLLLAQSDEDVNAVLIDFRQIDLTNKTASCPLCGRKHKTEQ